MSDTEFTTVEDVLTENEMQCEGAITALKRDLQKVRTGRASTGLVEGLLVEHYGAKTALSHLAQVSVPEANQIVIQVYDQGALAAVEKAITSSELGFNPSTEGNTLRITVPPLTEERRKDIVKMLHKTAEDIKISIRSHRRNSNESLKSLEKDAQVSKDDIKRGMDKIQAQTDNHIKVVDELLSVKEAECMEV